MSHKQFFLMLCLIFSTALSAQPIHLIWQAPRDGMCETDWVKEVLSEVEYTEWEDGQWSLFKDRSIIVIPRGSKAKKYLNTLQKKNYQFVVIQLGDERYSSKPEFYKNIPLVLRNYWHKMYDKNVRTFPLGYMRGFHKSIPSDPGLPSTKRTYTWSFAGQIEKSTRREMIQQMKKITHFKIHETSSFGDPQGLAIANYHELLSQTIFVPCPRGFWNLDSFRVYEALECGCIPIVENQPLDYFTQFLGKTPFPSVASWEEAAPLIEGLLANPELLEKKRLECYTWWLNYKKEMKKEIATAILRTLGTSEEGTPHLQRPI